MSDPDWVTKLADRSVRSLTRWHRAENADGSDSVFI